MSILSSAIALKKIENNSKDKETQKRKCLQRGYALKFLELADLSFPLLRHLFFARLHSDSRFCGAALAVSLVPSAVGTGPKWTQVVLLVTVPAAFPALIIKALTALAA